MGALAITLPSYLSQGWTGANCLDAGNPINIGILYCPFYITSAMAQYVCRIACLVLTDFLLVQLPSSTPQ